MNLLKPFLFVTLVSLFGITACEQGPMEKAGETIDDTVEDVGNKAEDACEEAKEGMEMKDTDC